MPTRLTGWPSAILATLITLALVAGELQRDRRDAGSGRLRNSGYRGSRILRQQVSRPRLARLAMVLVGRFVALAHVNREDWLFRMPSAAARTREPPFGIVWGL